MLTFAQCFSSSTTSLYDDPDPHIPLRLTDNTQRFTQAGSEVSALLGRIPSAVGYQPTLAVDMGGMQERITTTQKVRFPNPNERHTHTDILRVPSLPCRPSTCPLTI